MQYLAHDYNDNTIRFILHYPGIVDADILCKATKMLVDSVDILHGTFSANTMGAHWNINAEYEESSYFQFIETEGNPMVTACSLSLLPIIPEGKTQLRCSLVQSKTESAVVFNVSHLCVDGGDGKYLLGKLAEAYEIIYKKQHMCLNVKNGSRAPEQIYGDISLKEYISLLKNPIPGVKSEIAFATDDPGHICMMRVQISSEIMEKARNRAKAANATVNDLLLAATYHAYARMPEVSPNQPMSIMSMIDLRRHCKNGESEGLCNMSGSFPTVLHDGIGKEFADTLSMVAKQTCLSKEDPLAGMNGMPLLHGATRSLPMWLLLLIAGKVYGKFSVGLTNMGRFDCEELRLGACKPDEGFFGGPLKKKPGVQISAASFDGQCSLSIFGKYTREDTVLLQGMLDYIVEEITKYAMEKDVVV